MKNEIKNLKEKISKYLKEEEADANPMDCYDDSTISGYANLLLLECLKKYNDPIRAIMLEHKDENGEWTWYEVCRNSSPMRAIKKYLREMGLNEEQKIEKAMDGFYATEDEVRAYEIEIN
jgi:hypothetical protein